MFVIYKIENFHQVAKQVHTHSVHVVSSLNFKFRHFSILTISNCVGILLPCVLNQSILMKWFVLYSLRLVCALALMKREDGDDAVKRSRLNTSKFIKIHVKFFSEGSVMKIFHVLFITRFATIIFVAVRLKQKKISYALIYGSRRGRKWKSWQRLILICKVEFLIKGFCVAEA